LAHALIIGGIIFTRRSLNGVDYKFNSYHSVGRSRGGMIGYDGSRVKFDPKDPGGEHE
jgi:hypothetical protein